MNITFDIWKKAIKMVFTFDLWWRIISISAIQAVIIYPLVQFFIIPYITQGFDTSLSMLSDPSSITIASTYGAGIVILLTVLVIIEIAILSIAALHLTTKKYFKKDQIHPLEIFFQEAVALFIPFHLYLFRVMWYVLKPILFILVPFIIASFLLQGFKEVIPFEVLGGIVLFAIIIISIYYGVRVAFSIPFYFENYKNQSSEEIFNNSILFSKGKELSIFFSSLGLSVILGILGIIAGIIFAIIGIGGAGSDIENINSIGNNIINILFGGVQIVFFYVLYKVMELEKNITKK